MVIAVCKDKYRGHYTRSYIATHHPLLVIELNDTALSDLPTESGSGHDAGPYLIAHASFPPNIRRILAHNDEPQIPWGVIRLEFRDEKTVFGAIAPRGPHANDANVLAGNRIAQQNCFRCHNSGGEGGRKSGVSWTALGERWPQARRNFSPSTSAIRRQKIPRRRWQRVRNMMTQRCTR